MGEARDWEAAAAVVLVVSLSSHCAVTVGPGHRHPNHKAGEGGLRSAPRRENVACHCHRQENERWEGQHAHTHMHAHPFQGLIAPCDSSKPLATVRLLPVMTLNQCIFVGTE